MRAAPALLAVPAAMLGLALSVHPQSCPGATATLTATPDACVQPGDTVSVSVTGVPAGATVFLASSLLGTGAGTTFGPFGPIPAFTLCVNAAALFPLGTADGTGSIGFSFAIPPNAVLPGTLTLSLQALAVTFTLPPPPPPQFSIATTNTDALCF